MGREHPRAIDSGMTRKQDYYAPHTASFPPEVRIALRDSVLHSRIKKGRYESSYSDAASDSASSLKSPGRRNDERIL